jgi:hypothetical protein
MAETAAGGLLFNVEAQHVAPRLWVLSVKENLRSENPGNEASLLSEAAVDC